MLFSFLEYFMLIERFEEIVAWKKAKELTLEVYKLFEYSKDFGFKDQIQRASISIMNNIAEGFERGTHKQFQYFLYVAKGSCAEVRSMLIVAKDLGRITATSFQFLFGLTEEISKTIAGLLRSIK